LNSFESDDWNELFSDVFCFIGLLIAGWALWTDVRKALENRGYDIILNRSSAFMVVLVQVYCIEAEVTSYD